MRADAIAAGSSGLTSCPNFPLSSISAGPLGQSLAITWVPHAMASISTLPSPSCRDGSTTTAAARMNGRGFD